MQSRHRRRQRLTPIVDRRNEYVWSRALTAMGLQPLNSSTKLVAAKEQLSTAIPAPTPADASSGGEPNKKITILDLPLETQKAIFQHSSPSDLLSLCLVSKHFRHIAAEHLYRSFHIIFPTDDTPDHDSNVDPLAAGLETFATSEYDYGKYVREFIIEPTSGLEHTQIAYQDYLADTSCGKFLNTLLVLTLRKTKALETFKWDIRVEPSRQVYKTLHDLKALQHLHIRLHAGSSIYSGPLPNPVVNTNINNQFALFPQPAPQIFTFSPINTLPVALAHPHPTTEAYPGSSSYQFLPSNSLAYKSKYKQFKARLPTSGKVRPTLSAFKNLKSLAVLEMDSLDYVSEINRCIVRSWTTLHTLRLSFSEVLSMKSKKPQPEVHSDDDSDPDDDFTQLVPPQPGAPPPAAPLPGSNDAPTKAIKAQEEKKKQEAVLAQILGVDLAAVPTPPSPEVIVALPVAESTPGSAKRSPEDPRRAFARNLAPLGQLLLKIIKDQDDEIEMGKAALNIITKASQAYIDSIEHEEKAPSPAAEPGRGPNTSSTATLDPPYNGSQKASEGTTKPAEDDTSERGLFDEAEKKEKPQDNLDPGVANPDDIDVDEPEAPEVPDPIPEVETATSEDQDQDANEVTEEGGAKESENVPVPEEKAAEAIDETDTPLDGPKTTESDFYKYYLIKREHLHTAIESILKERDDIKTNDATDLARKRTLRKAADAYMNDLIDLQFEFKNKLGDNERYPNPDGGAEQMNEYVRQTRGLNLETLAIYLIPIKAAVLMRAINIHALRSITLLEVGHQNLFWASAAKQNSVSPLPLRKIYTDNVTLHFLAFVHQLECVEELLMVEKKPHSLVESSTPKTNVTIDQIRRTALKRHVKTLKVLMIQNDDTSDWDLNTESAILLCQRAKKLEELAVSFGIQTMHTILQFLSGLISLRALHTIDFRHDDNCTWVMREFRNFAVDAISHNPHMKLEYLALGLGVERLVRQIPKKANKGKGKARQGSGRNKSVADMLSSQTPGVPASESALALLKMGFGSSLPNSLDDSDDEDLRVGGKYGLIVETVHGIEFSDIPGVRIFEKDVLYGRL